MIFFETLDWTWNYDQALDLLVMMGQAMIRIYIFSDHPLSTSIINGHFDPEFPFDDVALYLAHLVFTPTPAPSASPMEFDPFEQISPHTILLEIVLDTFTEEDQMVLEILQEASDFVAVMENGFRTPWGCFTGESRTRFSIDDN